MMRRFAFFALSIAVVSVWPYATYGQTQLQAVVLHTTTEAGDESLALNVLFTVLDSTGQAIPKEAAQLEGVGQVYGRTISATPVEVTEATIPLKIALVIDNSGSMTPRIDSVKTAAINFVNKVPKNAEISVFTFAADVALVQDYTKVDQIASVETAIKNIRTEPAGVGNTCIYNAVGETLPTLASPTEQATQGRPAVVLFTDGRNDESQTGCGPLAEADVVDLAAATMPIRTQVHTIGLCTENDCNNINVGALEALAKGTNGRSRVGEIEELDALFDEVLSTLNNQWVAKANLKPRQGGNQNVTFAFNVRFNDAPARIILTTNFDSSRDYSAPPAQVRFADRIYNPVNDEYTVGLNVTNPEQIMSLNVLLRDASNNEIRSLMLKDLTEVMQVVIPAEGLKKGSDFFIDVMATDAKGALITDTMSGKYLNEMLSFEVAQRPPCSTCTLVTS